MAGEWSATENRPWSQAHHAPRSGVLGAPIETREREHVTAALVWIRANAIALALAVPILLGLVVRLIAVNRLSLQIDEPASLLGAMAVVEHGVPLLPSGALYLHGATLSYLLAPLVWLGFDGITDLQSLRLLNALIGTLSILLAYRIGVLATGRRSLALAAAFLVAIDPVSVQWSAHLRMYALLQVLTLAIALTYLHALGSGRRVPLLMVTLFALGAFTHVGVTLLWPAMVLVAVIVHGRTLLGVHRGLGLGLLLCLLGPLLFAALNRQFAPATRAGTAGISGSVLNDQTFLTLERLLRPSLYAWQSLFRADWYAELIPVLLTVLSGVIIGRFFLTENGLAGDASRIRIVGALLALYWIPVLLMGVLTTDWQPQYAMNIAPLGLLIAVIAVSELVRAGSRLYGNSSRGSWAPLLGAGIAGAVVVANLGQGLAFRLQNPTVEPDFGETLAFVAAHRAPDEIVLSAMTPPAYLVLGADNLVFLAGMEGTSRVASYTQRGADGRLTDYWVGVEAIGTVAGLCSTFAAHPGGWVLIDTVRLQSEPAFADPVATIVNDATTEVYRGGLGALVLRIKPADSWGAAATACGQASPGGATGRSGVHLSLLSARGESGQHLSTRSPTLR